MSAVTMNPHERVLRQRLADQRGGTVVFVSHCLLNENTRYLGGARCAGCVPDRVQQCLAGGVGIVQLPCPEQQAWGGVLKRRLLFAYGLQHRHPWLYRLRRLLVPLTLGSTRLVYRRLAATAARHIADYHAAGFRVLGVVGVDGSPSCGVATTLDRHAADDILALSPNTITVDQFTALVRRHATPGAGLFVDELTRQLRRRRLAVPFLAHDLLAELAGQPTRVRLSAAPAPSGAPTTVPRPR